MVPIRTFLAAQVLKGSGGTTVEWQDWDSADKFDEFRKPAVSPNLSIQVSLLIDFGRPAAELLNDANDCNAVRLVRTFCEMIAQFVRAGGFSVTQDGQVIGVK
jgi:hypothetical protein